MIESCIDKENIRKCLTVKNVSLQLRWYIIYFNCSQRLLEGALKLHKGQSQDEDKRAGMGTGTG